MLEMGRGIQYSTSRVGLDFLVCFSIVNFLFVSAMDYTRAPSVISYSILKVGDIKNTAYGE